MNSFAELRDPAAIARARAELDAAEQRAQADAAAARQRALDDARGEEDALFRAEVASSLGPTEPVLAALDAVAAAKQRHAEAMVEAQRADGDVEAARAAIPRLVKRKVAGEDITRDDVLAAHAAVTEAEHFATFQAIVASNLAPLIAEAEAAYKVADAAAHEPVLQRGIDLRIEAAAAADKVKSPLPGRTDRAAMDAARVVFLRGNRMISLACEHGLRTPSAAGGISSYWPETERSERLRWNRPAPGGAA